MVGRAAVASVAVGGLIALALVGCRGSDTTVEKRPCDGTLAGYLTKGKALAGDVDGDGRSDRVTLRAGARQPPRCRHVLVVETGPGSTAVGIVKPLTWPGTDPQLLLLAQIDGHPGLEPVVELSPAAVYRPGAVFTMRRAELVRMRLEAEDKVPEDLFPLDDEFPAGVNCARRPGTIVATFGGLAKHGADDRHFDLTRSLYRAAGTRFEVVRRERFRVGIHGEAGRRWPELRGRPFISCTSS
jgi:hypothetical protein